MPKQDFRLITVTLLLENNTHLVEALLFPEVSRYGTNPKRLHEAITSSSSNILEELQPVELHKRRIPVLPELIEVTLKLDPPAKSLAWREPVSLKLHTVRWSHGEEARIAFIPALDIEVITRDPDELDRLVIEHARAELMRKKVSTSLGQILWLERCRDVRLDQFSISVNIRSPKQIATNLEAGREAKKSVLKEVGIDLTQEPLPEAYEMKEAVSRIAEILVGRNPRSILLVGSSGVGKTATVYELVRRRNYFGLGRTPFWATSGSRLIAGMSGFGMWQQRCQELWREASKQNAVLYLGSLVELMEVGKYASSSQGIAGFLRPYLARGDMIAIAECTPEQIPLIEREDPHLLGVFYQIKLEEPSVEKGRSILLSYTVGASQGAEPPIDLDGLETLDRLHRRYATYSAYPGRPIRFLKNLLQDRPDDRVLTTGDIISAFSRETGLPLFLLDDSVRLDLDETRKWFADRVIGQQDAVNLVTDLLATVKAGLLRPERPIASLLFIGPTGVGKTEMAKSLAEYLFQDRNRILRFDMSEYADSISVKRLIGGVFGSEGLLTSRVREQPFSVLLLDEFEKAHPLFFDLLLQVLGEGRLTDAAGRLADFRNSVVIMTSNLGAESFQRGSIGFSLDPKARREAQRHFISEVRAFVRPELFNRIDKIVPFAPLDEETILLVARRELERLKSRDGIRYRGVSLNVTDELAAYLARKGYDPKYGARPLKRAIERELLVPLSEDLNRYGAELALSADIRVGDRLKVTVRPRVDSAGKQISAVVTEPGLYETANGCASLRRLVQRLEWSHSVLEIQNEVFRIEKLEKQLSRRSWKKQEDLDRLARLPRYRQVLQNVKALSERVYSMEDSALFALYGKTRPDKERLASDLEAASKEWREALLSVYSLRFKNPDYVTLAVYSEHAERLFELSRAYHALAVGAGAEVEVIQITIGRIDQEKDQTQGRVLALEKGTALLLQKVSKPESFLAEKREGIIGIAMGISGSLVYPCFEKERGLHVFKEAEKAGKCLVHTSEAPIEKYLPPPGITRRGAIANQEGRREYNFDEYFVSDALLKRKLQLPGRRINDVLKTAINDRLFEDAKSTIIGGD